MCIRDSLKPRQSSVPIWRFSVPIVKIQKTFDAATNCENPNDFRVTTTLLAKTTWNSELGSNKGRPLNFQLKPVAASVARGKRTHLRWYLLARCVPTDVWVGFSLQLLK
eukprot:2130073-Amphidinium_carterae.1